MFDMLRKEKVCPAYVAYSIKSLRKQFILLMIPYKEGSHFKRMNFIPYFEYIKTPTLQMNVKIIQKESFWKVRENFPCGY